MATNDNDPDTEGAMPLSDAHGRAALLLVESLIHGLCENASLSTGEAIEIADRAASVQLDQAETEGAGALLRRSHALLLSIATSLATDQKGGPPTSRPI